MSIAGTIRTRRYVLQVVSSGHFVFAWSLLASPRGRAPVVQMIAKPAKQADAPSFWGGPRLDRLIEELGKGGMDLFPTKVDR